MKKIINNSLFSGVLISVFLTALLICRSTDRNSLFEQNVEALSQSEEGSSFKDNRDRCISGGVTTVTTSKSGTLTILGYSLSLEPSKSYVIAYSVWDCEECKDQSCTPKGTVIQSITKL